MKIGIITYHYCLNYGAVLQVYALSKKLKAMGHEPIVINYIPLATFKQNKQQLRPESAKKRAKDTKGWLKHGPLSRFYVRLVSRYTFRALNPGFQEFRNKYLTLTHQAYGSIDELQANPPDCDAYICGSDQIWNPHDHGVLDMSYFLHFGNSETRRISYAASFGRSSLPEEWHPKINNALKKIEHLSVREHSGVELIKRVAGRKAECVLDPTLLCSDFSEVLSVNQKYSPQSYVLVYRLQQSGHLTASMTKLIRYVSKKLGLRVLNISPQPYRFWKEAGEIVNPSPQEWLTLIRDASFVITNSFHGTAFCTTFEVPFISFARDAVPDRQNTRMIDFLKSLKLRQRYLNPSYTYQSIDELLASPIDWCSAKELLSAQRTHSIGFLEQALSEKPHH